MTDADKTDCGNAAGTMVPVIDPGRCEAKAECVKVCPYHVFEIRTLTTEERAELSLLGRLKAWAHGNKRALAVRAEACHACGLCVKACPEQAITLRTAVTQP